MFIYSGFTCLTCSPNGQLKADFFDAGADCECSGEASNIQKLYQCGQCRQRSRDQDDARVCCTGYLLTWDHRLVKPGQAVEAKQLA